jgi:hypothetical protein
MIIIPINPADIKEAKEQQIQFDKQKSHDKFVCSTNYIGLLGEITLHKYLEYNNIEHLWINFIKKDYTKPDFIINNKTIDLKCTYSDSLWIQEPKFDIYMYSQITKDEQFMVIKGVMQGCVLQNSIVDKSAKQVRRGNRVDYVFPQSSMLPVESLLVGTKCPLYFL